MSLVVSTTGSDVDTASAVVVTGTSWTVVEVPSTTFAAGSTVFVATSSVLPLLLLVSPLSLLSPALLLSAELWVAAAASVLVFEALSVVFGTAVHRFPSRVVINPPAGRDMIEKEKRATSRYVESEENDDHQKNEKIARHTGRSK